MCLKVVRINVKEVIPVTVHLIQLRICVQQEIRRWLEENTVNMNCVVERHFQQLEL